MSALKKLLGQTAMYGLPSIVWRFLNYLLTPFLTRAFLPEEYGIVGELYAYAGLFAVILTYGMETGYFRYASKHPKPDILFSATILPLAVSSLIFFFITFLFSGEIASVLHYAEHPEFIVWFAAILAADALSAVPFAKLRLEGKAKKFALFRLINIFTNIIVTIWFVVLCKNNDNKDLQHFFVSSFAFMYNDGVGVGYVFVANFAASLLTLLLFIPDFFKISLKIPKETVRDVLKYSLPLLFAGIAGMINEVADRIFIKYFTVIPETVTNADAYVRAQVGIYSANYKLAILMTLFIQAFRYAAEPFFFKQAKNNDSKKTFSDVMTVFTAFCFLIFLGVMLYIDIAKLFIAEEYRVGLSVVPVLLIANVFLGIIYNLSIWYKLTDKTRYGAYIAGFGAFITIVANILLIPPFGYYGAAWATLICYFLMALLSYYFGQKFYKIDYKIGRIAFYAILTAGIFVLDIFVDFEKLLVELLFNSLLIVAFALIFLFKEKLYLKFLHRNPVKKH